MTVELNLFGEQQTLPSKPVGQRVTVFLPYENLEIKVIGNVFLADDFNPEAAKEHQGDYSHKNLVRVVVDLKASDFTHEELTDLPDFFDFENGDWICKAFDFECEVTA